MAYEKQRHFETPFKVVEAGYNTILSAPWYYDWHQYNKDVPEWETAWGINMLQGWFSPDDYKHVLGGEGCMWTEFVDSANIYARIFPKLLATAERLWSNPDKKITIGW